MIGIALLRRPLFFQARQLIIRTAERNGIPWRVRRRELQQAAAPLLSSTITPASERYSYLFLLPAGISTMRFTNPGEGDGGS